jgi:hypothetical protein
VLDRLEIQLKALKIMRDVEEGAACISNAPCRYRFYE